MGLQKSSNTYDAIARLLGTTPPLAPDVLSGDTRLAGRWINPPFDGLVPPLNEHCLVRHVTGQSESWVKSGGKAVTNQMLPGTLSLVPKGQASWRRSGSPMEVSNVYLGDGRLQSCADLVAHGQRPELIDRVGFTDTRLFTIMTLLCDEVESREPTSRLFMEQLIDLLCLQLLRLHFMSVERGEIAARRGLAGWQVKRVTGYMRDHMATDIGLQELADSVGLSRFHFCHAFRLATGYTPHQWLTRQRIARARELLASPQLRIIDIALAVGYQTPSAFAASFRKIAGATPTEFRRRL
jgi:AraC family transcriptional regulator